ncbi:MOSC and FAD-binding oxidoreductase domain-containing protein [Paractinoplanes ferrugineus]|uniref:Sulfurase n=1 Tax=Paractinoplanes ferrugineus TaxID=113564 RepID=A0A919J144_9ACTN|nr:3-alpha domain-containing protein [Actinoplanes ferrugineus]GIE12821.1 sulfurase [Actinoplanes ferrugineus]
MTQPRVTCYRVGLRLADPRMPALLVQHHRPGFYLRVLREGPVRAGDEIVKVADGPQALTVAETDALLYLPGHPREQLERALRMPALSPGWQASFRAMLAEPASASGNAGLTDATRPPAWTGFRPLRVTAVEPESTTITSIRLADPDGAPLPAAQPGQFLTVRTAPAVVGRDAPAGPAVVVRDPPAGQFGPAVAGRDPLAGPARPAVVRSYSLSGRPGDAGYRISVKHEPHGRGSGYLSTKVRPGDLLDVAAPRGSFVLRPAASPVLLISGGVGATPVLAMLHALAAERSTREIWWFQAARNAAERPFASEVVELLAALPSARSFICLSHPTPADRGYDATGRLSAAAFRSLGLSADADAYLCGPAAFLTDVTAALVETGLSPSRLHTEIFGARPGLTPGISAAPSRPPHPPTGEPGNGPSVSFARSGLTVPWPTDEPSLLELAEACDVPVRWSCRTGVCHNCESGLLSGDVTYTLDPVDPPAAGNALICCSRPNGPIVLDL